MKKIFAFSRAAALAAFTFGLAAVAQAEQVEMSLLNCSTANCRALVLQGRINGHPASPAIASAWTMQVAGKAGYCLRAHVTSASTNLAMSVVAPDGTVFTNGDSNKGACKTCPLVVAPNTVDGFYSIVVGAQSGQSSEASFVLKAGLYKTGNAANCAGATPGR